jgi:predicted DNA-binding protein
MALKRSKTSIRLRLKKVPVLAYLEPEQVTALKALSERTRVPQQVYLREGVEWVLEKHNRPAPIKRYIELKRRAK